jgi:MFS family permease
MVILDSAIVVVALSSIDADLAFSARNLQWVLSAYLLSFGGLLLLGGRAARRVVEDDPVLKLMTNASMMSKASFCHTTYSVLCATGSATYFAGSKV